MPSELIANKYKVVREIARSNDIVYEAVDTAMGRRVAVKELNLPPNLTGQAKRERVERFNREARAAGKLSHPNIVTVFGFGEDEGRHYIAMEFLEGQTLRDVLQARGALPLNEAKDIALQVLAALSHAHSRQVVHRDIKPDNIQILPGGQIKLTDFGIARLTEEASLTGEGQVFGTPSYMSPEQIEGRFIDHRSDLFSLGVVLYEMLAGRKPFTGDSVVSITYAIMHNDPLPLAGVPIGVEQVVFRALAKDPARRYSSADEMRAGLQNADAVPSMFLPRQPTSMGGPYGAPPPAYGQPGGYGNMPVPAYQPPSMPPALPPAYGGVPAPVPSTAYAPPPQPAAPASSGPFVNWGATQAGQQPSYIPPPPPYPPRPAGPILSENAKTTIGVFFLSIVLGAAVVGFLLLFLRAYDQQKKVGPEVAVSKLVSDGDAAFKAHQYDKAVSKFSQAYQMGRGTKSGETARVNLAITLNELGLAAFNNGDLKTAEKYWDHASDIDPNNSEVQYNLGKLYDRMGDHDRAMQQWQRSANGMAGDTNPAAPADQTSLQSRYERARTYYNQGMEALNQGNIDQARNLWQKAVGEAPGTDVAIRAQKNLDATTSSPNF